MVFKILKTGRRVKLSLNDILHKKTSEIADKLGIQAIDVHSLLFEQVENLEESEFLVQLFQWLNPDNVLIVVNEPDDHCAICTMFDKTGKEIDSPSDIINFFGIRPHLFLCILSPILFQEAIDRGLTTVRFSMLSEGNIIMDAFNPPNGKELYSDCVSGEDMETYIVDIPLMLQDMS